MAAPPTDDQIHLELVSIAGTGLPLGSPYTIGYEGQTNPTEFSADSLLDNTIHPVRKDWGLQRPTDPLNLQLIHNNVVLGSSTLHLLDQSGSITHTLQVGQDTSRALTLTFQLSRADELEVTLRAIHGNLSATHSSQYGVICGAVESRFTEKDVQDGGHLYVGRSWGFHPRRGSVDVKVVHFHHLRKDHTLASHRIQLADKPLAETTERVPLEPDGKGNQREVTLVLALRAPNPRDLVTLRVVSIAGHLTATHSEDYSVTCGDYKVIFKDEDVGGGCKVMVDRTWGVYQRKTGAVTFTVTHHHLIRGDSVLAEHEISFVNQPVGTDWEERVGLLVDGTSQPRTLKIVMRLEPKVEE